LLAVTGPWVDVDDAGLLRAHAGGNTDAFGELVRRHRDRLWAVAVRTLADREEAADALQDALLSAYRAASGFRGDSAVTTWLHRIVVNACLDRARRRQARPVVGLPDADSGREPAMLDPDRDTPHEVWSALAQLPPEQRIPIVLLDMHGYSVAEIALRLGVAEGTVKSRCARGRARLAVLLGHLRVPTGNPMQPSDVAPERAPHQGGVVGSTNEHTAGVAAPLPPARGEGGAP
jgi:RNA polymerase sigma-70 factor (ECF subfamily)